MANNPDSTPSGQVALTESLRQPPGAGLMSGWSGVQPEVRAALLRALSEPEALLLAGLLTHRNLGTYSSLAALADTEWAELRKAASLNFGQIIRVKTEIKTIGEQIKAIGEERKGGARRIGTLKDFKGACCSSPVSSKPQSMDGIHHSTQSLSARVLARSNPKTWNSPADPEASCQISTPTRTAPLAPRASPLGTAARARCQLVVTRARCHTITVPATAVSSETVVSSTTSPGLPTLPAKGARLKDDILYECFERLLETQKSQQAEMEQLRSTVKEQGARLRALGDPAIGQGRQAATTIESVTSAIDAIVESTAKPDSAATPTKGDDAPETPGRSSRSFSLGVVDLAALELDKAEDASLDASMWDVVLLIGTPPMGRAASQLLVFLFVGNIIIQSLFIYLLGTTSLTTPNYERALVNQYRSWRRNEARTCYALTCVDLGLLSLRQRVVLTLRDLGRHIRCPITTSSPTRRWPLVCAMALCSPRAPT